MNPFDLPGPQFLLFYLLLIAAVLMFLWKALNEAETGRPPALPLADPYQIAWLRGGTPEAARVAVLSLTDRGLLKLTGERLAAAGVGRVSGLPEIELAILRSCEVGDIPATAVLDDPGVAAACEAYRTQLETIGLVRDERMRERRFLSVSLAIAVLVGVSLAKLALAIERGHSNVGFLIILTVAAVAAACWLASGRRTTLGSRVLRDLRTLFAALRERAGMIRPGAMTSDAMLLAAVFGLSALPEAAFPEVRRAYKKAASDSGWGCGGGSSCGSGCGGGGGGCGGCGSG